MRSQLVAFAFLGAALAAPARAAPLPDSDQLVLQALFDGCLDPALRLADPREAATAALKDFKPEPITPAAADASAGDAKAMAWRMRAVDADVEYEAPKGQAWCEVRLIDGDPGRVVRRLNAELGRMGLHVERKSAPASAPGRSAELAVLQHDPAYVVVLTLDQARTPRPGEAGLILNVRPMKTTDEPK